MLKKIALSAAAIFAAVALAQPPAAMAANWDSRSGNTRGYSNNNGYSQFVDRNDYRGVYQFNRDRDDDRRLARRPFVYQQPVRRVQAVRAFVNHNRDWR
jgi:hypothetical protein